MKGVFIWAILVGHCEELRQDPGDSGATFYTRMHVLRINYRPEVRHFPDVSEHDRHSDSVP